MNALRASISRAASLGAPIAALIVQPVAAQTVVFDDKPTGFLTVQTGGMPADSWRGTSLAAAKRLVPALQPAAAGGRRAEASLLGPIAAGETPLGALHPATVAAIVRTERQVGEDHAARLFAVETAIAYGL